MKNKVLDEIQTGLPPRSGVDQQQCPRCREWFYLPPSKRLLPCTPDSNLHRIVPNKDVNWTIRDLSKWPPTFVWKGWPEREYQTPDEKIEARILTLSSQKKKIFKKYLDMGFDRRPALALARI